MTDNEYGSVCVKNSGGLLQTVYFETIKDKLNVRIVTTAKILSRCGDGFISGGRLGVGVFTFFVSVTLHILIHVHVT
jgi:hypothetical protein